MILPTIGVQLRFSACAKRITDPRRNYMGALGHGCLKGKAGTKTKLAKALDNLKVCLIGVEDFSFRDWGVGLRVYSLP